MTVKDIARLLAKVETRGEEECWGWREGHAATGYGQFSVYGRTIGAHRAMLALALGRPVAELRIVRHSCDNPGCVNPAHLSDGTHRDNQFDKVERGRQAKGEVIHQSRLKVEDVQEIVRLYATGNYSQRDLAKQFGVRHASIGKILRGDNWKHIERADVGEVLDDRKRGEFKAHRGETIGTSRLTEAQVRELRALWRTGQFQVLELARKFDVSETCAANVVHGRTWAHTNDAEEKNLARTCVVCGGKFETTDSRKKYCGEGCRNRRPKKEQRTQQSPPPLIE